MPYRWLPWHTWGHFVRDEQQSWGQDPQTPGFPLSTPAAWALVWGSVAHCCLFLGKTAQGSCLLGEYLRMRLPSFVSMESWGFCLKIRGWSAELTQSC